VKSYKAKGKRITRYMVDNIKEIEPVVKKETAIPVEEKPKEELPPPAIHEDPAQMKLEL
jgi:topoisomerase-4 subunit A